VGAAILGFCIGLMVALAEVVFRRFWLEIAVSPREVRTVTLGGAPVTLGGDERAVTFFVAGAPRIALRYRVRGEEVLCEDVPAGETTIVSAGERRTLVKVTVTLRSPTGARQTGYALRLSGGKSLPLQEGLPLTADDLPGLQAKGADEIVALVSRHPTRPREVSLRNRSNQPWTAIEPDGRRTTVEPGRGVELAEGLRLYFGRVEGVIVEDEELSRRRRR
jgi:hypothetical protein